MQKIIDRRVLPYCLTENGLKKIHDFHSEHTNSIVECGATSQIRLPTESVAGVSKRYRIACFFSITSAKENAFATLGYAFPSSST